MRGWICGFQEAYQLRLSSRGGIDPCVHLGLAGGAYEHIGTRCAVAPRSCPGGVEEEAVLERVPGTSNPSTGCARHTSISNPDTDPGLQVRNDLALLEGVFKIRFIYHGHEYAMEK